MYYEKKVCINIFVGKGCAAVIVMVKWYNSVIIAVGLLQSVSIQLSLCLWISILVVRVKLLFNISRILDEYGVVIAVLAERWNDDRVIVVVVDCLYSIFILSGLSSAAKAQFKKATLFFRFASR